MTTMDVKDAAGATIPIEKPLAPARAAAANSRPVALSNEDKAVLDALVVAVDALRTAKNLDDIVTAIEAIGGFTDGLETLITSSNTALAGLHTDLATTLAGLITTINGYVDQLEGYTDGLEGLVGSTNTALTTLNAKDFATQTTLAAVLAKLTADPATQTTLAAVLAKLIAAPATEAKQDTGNTSLASIVTALATNHTDELQLHTDIATTLIAKDEAIRTLLAGTLTVGLPSGAATAANQATQHTDLVNLLTQIVLAAGTAIIGKVDHTTTGAGDNRKVVTTAGTRVALAAATPAKWVTITAEEDNTGVVVVGGATVVAALATRRGTPLSAMQSVTFPVDDLADISLDAMVSTDGVTFTYGT